MQTRVLQHWTSNGEEVDVRQSNEELMSWGFQRPSKGMVRYCPLGLVDSYWCYGGSKCWSFTRAISAKNASYLTRDAFLKMTSLSVSIAPKSLRPRHLLHVPISM